MADDTYTIRNVITVKCLIFHNLSRVKTEEVETESTTGAVNEAFLCCHYSQRSALAKDVQPILLLICSNAETSFAQKTV